MAEPSASASFPIPDATSQPDIDLARGSVAIRFGTWSALLVLLCFFLAQGLGGAVAGLVAGIGAGLGAGTAGLELRDPETWAFMSHSVAASGMVVGMLFSGIVVLRLARYFVGDYSSDSFIHGLGWTRCTCSSFTLGMLAGGVLGLIYLLVALFLVPPDPTTSLGPLTQIANRPGIPRLAWMFLALVVAPPLEEFLFRGVLFAGFSRSFGLTAASILVTALFTLLHLPETIHYWPAAVAITLVGLFALILRIRAQSLGPAVALHFAYNLVIVLAVFAPP